MSVRSILLVFQFSMALPLIGSGATSPSRDSPLLSLRGFGTLGVVYSDEEEADFVNSEHQPNGAGHTRAWDIGVDSKLGIQLDARFSNKLSAVLQLVAQHRHDNSYTPEVEWANIQYQATPQFNIRVGRILIPMYMYSNIRLLGFSYPWVRPPLELYEGVPSTSADGVDVQYQFNTGEWLNTVQVGIGGFSETHPDGADLDTRKGWGISYTLERDPISLRLHYSAARVDYDGGELGDFLSLIQGVGEELAAFPILQPIADEAFSIAERYALDNERFWDLIAGVHYDPGPWFLMVEWGRAGRSALLTDSDAWYLSGGYRLGSVTPFASFARLDTENHKVAGLPIAGLPPFLAEPLESLNVALNRVLRDEVTEQQTLSLGIRWYLTENVGLKLQYDHIDLGSDSVGTLVNIQENFERGGTVNLFSATIDFVF